MKSRTDFKRHPPILTDRPISYVLDWMSQRKFIKHALVATTAVLLFSFTIMVFAAKPDLSDPVARLPASARPSIAETTRVTFAGKEFVLRDKATNQPVQIWEYFPPSADITKWDELVGFQIYPVTQDGNEPMDHAVRTAKLFKRQFPQMQFALYSDKTTGAALLDFFYPTSNRKDAEFMEFDSFKFFKDANTDNVICFHYAKNIPSGPDRNPQAIAADIKATRTKIIPAMAKFPLYRK